MTHSHHDPFEGIEKVDEALLCEARAVWDSQMYASACGECYAAIGPGQPVEIVPRKSFYRFKNVGRLCGWIQKKVVPILGSYGRVAICAKCSEERNKWRDEWERPDRYECECCGRPIYGHLRWVVKRPAACSFHCLKAIYRRRRARTPSPIACAVCGKSFTPHRSDAKVCGGACRQKAYRDRRRVMARGVSRRMGHI
jgi:hypothetical protein